MASKQLKEANQNTMSTILQHWIPPAITASLGLVAGIALSSYNSGISENRFFLEKRTVVADNIANEFSEYIVNWSRLIQLRKRFDKIKEEPSEEERENFKRIVFKRDDAREKLFSYLDYTHLYFSESTSNLILSFCKWDTDQSVLTVDKLPDVQEWRTWQVNILRHLHKEISE